MNTISSDASQGTITFIDENGDSTILDIKSFAVDPEKLKLEGDVSGTLNRTKVEKLQGVPVNPAAPIENQVLTFDGENWIGKEIEIKAIDVKEGKALMSTDFDLSGTASTSLLKEVTANIKTGAVTSEKILDGTIKPIDIANAGSNEVLITNEKGKPEWSSQDKLVTVNNGLSKSGINIELGGELIKSTKITTTSQNTLSLVGLQKGGNNDNVVVIDSQTSILKQLKSTMPKFFYMPSMAMPITEGHILPNMHGNYEKGTFTIDLYAVYAEQFGGTNPETSTANAGKTTVLPVLNSRDMDYFITYYDKSVYQNVSVDNDGKLQYTISPTADPSFISFMNIVFSVKP